MASGYPARLASDSDIIPALWRTQFRTYTECMFFAIVIFLACLMALDIFWSVFNAWVLSRFMPTVHAHVERRWWLYRSLIWLLALLSAWLLSDAMGYPR